MARAGADDVLIANQLVHPAKRRAAALLARDVHAARQRRRRQRRRGAVRGRASRQARSSASWSRWTPAWAAQAWMTRMRRCGWRAGSSSCPACAWTGCRGTRAIARTEPDRERRHALQQAAMAYLVSVADHLVANGIPCPILSAAGTATAFWTGSDPRITELQLGSYAAMDSITTSWSPRSGWRPMRSRRSSAAIPTEAGPGHGQQDLRRGRGWTRRTRHAMRGHEGLQAVPLRRGARDPTRSRGPATCVSAMSSDFHIGYTPFAVNYFDAYHVTDGGPIVDIWPVMPRGPQHGGLLAEVGAA